MKKLLSVFLIAGMLLAMAACGGAPASSGTASGSAAASGSGGSAEPSGKLVIYSPNSDTQVASSLTNGFMVKYPNIEVELQSMGTGDVLARIEAEKENPQADCENARRMRKGPTGWSFECKNLQDAEKWPYKAVFW